MKGRGLSVYSRDQKAERSWGTGIPVYLFCGGYSGEMERKEREAGKKKNQKTLELVRGRAEGWRRSQYLVGRRLLGSSPSKRVRSKEAESSEVQSGGARLT